MHRKFDESFKIMAVELTVVKGSVAEAAKELEINPSLLSKWRRNPHYNGNKVLPDNVTLVAYQRLNSSFLLPIR